MAKKRWQINSSVREIIFFWRKNNHINKDCSAQKKTKQDKSI